MSNLRILAMVIGVALIPTLSAGASGSDLPTLISRSPHTQIQSVRGMAGRFAVLPAKNFDPEIALSQAAARTTIPLWRGHAVYKGTNYVYEMVGRTPFVAQTEQTTDVNTVIVPVRLVFTSFGNATFDPNQKDQMCSPKGSASLLVSASPLFKIGRAHV